MALFFKDFASLDQFTRSLESHVNQTQCSHCLKHDQFVSHGIVYKQRSIALREPVGKRLLCSNRYGRTGCGRTVQLSIAGCIPQLRYSAKRVSLFISLLLAHVGISRAYQQATGQSETRHAWRWINKLIGQLSRYRSVFNTRVKQTASNTPYHSHTLALLLPTFAQMLSPTDESFCHHYQLQHQCAFM